MDDPLGIVLQSVVGTLEQLGISYYVGGSVASMTYGEYRQTADVDIVADLRLEHVPAFMPRVATEFFTDEFAVRDAIAHRSSFNLLHRSEFFKVDVFILRERPYDLEALRRRQREVVEVEPLVEAYLAAPDDILLTKLEWFRMGGETSERQWRDVLGIIKLQLFDLDFEYLRHWAQEIAVADLLEKALDDAGINKESIDGNSD
jgi:hypothetical protein